ncbi:MAG: hypothetical protein ACRDH9_11835 [Actinomycetota bacterium]
MRGTSGANTPPEGGSHLRPQNTLIGPLAAALMLGAAPALADAPIWDHDRASLARLEEARERLSSGSLADAVMAAAELSGVGTIAPAAPPTTVTGVPAQIAAPVRDLVASIGLAGRMAEDSLRAEPAVIERGAGSLISALARSHGLADEAAAADRWNRRWSETVDRSSLYAAALVVARAVDRALPALRARVPELPSAAAGCNVANQPPVLCIGNTGANEYTADYALLIDLGGNDTYANSAGGADPQVTNIPVSVTIDTGGADTYAATLPTPSGARVAQGAGLVGGIGVLVDDGAGNDSFSATSNESGAGAWAQGFSMAGVGIFAEMDGNDTMTISNLGPYADNGGAPLPTDFYAAGQGVSSFGGLAVSIGMNGNDARRIEARPSATLDPEGILHPGDGVLAHGFGVGTFGGVGLFAHPQHAETMTVEAVSARVEPDETRSFIPPVVNVFGFGTGGVGVGLSVTGGGTSTRTLRAVAEAPVTGSAIAGGFGRGTIGGYGALHDSNGNDVYRVEAISNAATHHSVDDSCACSGTAATADSGLAFIDAALGAGGLGGVGVLQDAGGNDSYIAAASALSEARARDLRTTPVPPQDTTDPRGAKAASHAGVARIHAEGFGINGAAGFLLDSGGTDQYTAVATSAATAVASSDIAPSDAVAGAAPEPSVARVQGASVEGYGELFDAQGADIYASTSSSVSNETTNGVEESTTAPSTTSAQGSTELGVGILRDADNGLTDTFSTAPEDAACMGTRGTGVWRDCDQGVGVGANV